MADAATISITATMLPDEIAKTITGSMTVTPSTTGLGGKWYYKETTVLASAILISGNFMDHVGITANADKVEFLFIKNAGTVTAQDAYITLDGGTSAADVADGIVIGLGESWVGRMPSTLVDKVMAFATASTTLIVAALIVDAS